MNRISTLSSGAVQVTLVNRLAEEAGKEMLMLAIRADQRLARLIQAIAMLAITGGLWVAIGSGAQADEFLLRNAFGQPVPNAMVRIEDEQGQFVTTVYTDMLGRFVVPYQGTVTTYRVTRNGNEAELLVTGARGMRPITLE
jgi:hypothetical protein